MHQYEINNFNYTITILHIHEIKLFYWRLLFS